MEVDKYFQHFERVAQNLRWPTDQWPLLLQSVLKWKAQEAYTALPISECVDYTCVNNTILKPYELVSEAYNQKFRNYRKQESQRLNQETNIALACDHNRGERHVLTKVCNLALCCGVQFNKRLPSVGIE